MESSEQNRTGAATGTGAGAAMTPEKMTDAEIVKELAEDVMGWSGTSIPGVWHIGTGLGLRRFDPLLDGNDMLMVVDALTAKKFYVTMIPQGAGEDSLVIVEYWYSDPQIDEHASDPCIKRAVALAALKAIRAEKETK